MSNYPPFFWSRFLDMCDALQRMNMFEKDCDYVDDAVVVDTGVKPMLLSLVEPVPGMYVSPVNQRFYTGEVFEVVAVSPPFAILEALDESQLRVDLRYWDFIELSEEYVEAAIDAYNAEHDEEEDPDEE